MGDYWVPGKYLFSKITDIEVMAAPKITNKTIEIGVKYSPEFVCTPFKYTLGSMIEALENGADILIQPGGGCRYGYYSELQETILKNQGYNFKLINLVVGGKTNVGRVYKMMKEINPNLKIIKSLYYLLITIKMVKYMDKIDHYIRLNIGFEVKKHSFIKLKEKMLLEFSKVNNPISLYFKYLGYKRKFKKIKINKPDNPLRVGIIGELYTIMEPFSNYFLESELAKFNIEITRYTNAYYLLREKKKTIKKVMKNTKEYQKYPMEADSSHNIYWTKYMCLNKYDGIIHIKSAFCTPEIAIIPILNKVCKDYNVPIIYFSFDSNTSEVGIKTRLEAFKDMLEMRRSNE